MGIFKFEIYWNMQRSFSVCYSPYSLLYLKKWPHWLEGMKTLHKKIWPKGLHGMQTLHKKIHVRPKGLHGMQTLAKRLCSCEPSLTVHWLYDHQAMVYYTFTSSAGWNYISYGRYGNLNHCTFRVHLICEIIHCSIPNVNGN